MDCMLMAPIRMLLRMSADCQPLAPRLRPGRLPRRVLLCDGRSPVAAAASAEAAGSGGEPAAAGLAFSPNSSRVPGPAGSAPSATSRRSGTAGRVTAAAPAAAVGSAPVSGAAVPVLPSSPACCVFARVCCVLSPVCRVLSPVGGATVAPGHGWAVPFSSTPEVKVGAATGGGGMGVGIRGAASSLRRGCRWARSPGRLSQSHTAPAHADAAAVGVFKVSVERAGLRTARVTAEMASVVVVLQRLEQPSRAP